MAASASGAKVEKTFSSPSRYRETFPSVWWPELITARSAEVTGKS
jgi:hypothetical protein